MQRIEFPLQNGGQILVETVDEIGPKAAVEPETEGSPSGRRLASTRRGGGAATAVVEKSQATFEEAAAGITPIAEAILDQVKKAGPDQVTVEFGIKLGVEAGVILTSTKGEAHCKITLTWKKD